MRQKGFTLIELVLSMGLAAIVLSVSTFIFVSAATKNSQGVNQESLEQFKNDAAVELTNAIKWGNTFTCTSCDGNSNATLTINTQTSYYISNGVLVKKDIAANTESPISGSNVVVNAFKITAFTTAVDSNGTVYPSYKISLTMRSNVSTTTDTVDIVVSNRKQAVTL